MKKNLVKKKADLFKFGSRLGSKKILIFTTIENFTSTLQYEKSSLLPLGTKSTLNNYYFF